MHDSISSTSLTAILSSNEKLRARLNTSTAVFTGATQGIGLGTLRSFLKHVPKPKAFIVGRSHAKFAGELTSLRVINPAATLIFIEAQLSLISEVDRVCADIQAQLSRGDIDILCMSQGYAPFGDRIWTPEGLDEVTALIYYGRMRMAEQLIASGAISPTARILSIGGAGKEGPIVKDDLELRNNWSLFLLRGHITCVMSLTFDILAKEHPDMTFIHAHPGMVNTNLLNHGGSSFLFGLFITVLRTYVSFFGITPEESGERMLWLATDEKFAKGSYTLLETGIASQSRYLAEYRKDAVLSEAIRDHLTEIYERAQSSNL